jgi:hypothetical protein
MRNAMLISIAVVGFAYGTLAFGEAARPPSVPSVTRAPAPNTKASRFTDEECVGLGGVIINDSRVCPSGRYCYTTDPNNKEHMVCIDKK